MPEPLNELKARVRAQKSAVPALYGKIDFDLVPERFTADPSETSMLREPLATRRRPEILADGERVERALAHTMLGDPVADAYAARFSEYGVKGLIERLVRACEHGVEAVPDAPPELERFIAEMEREPEWIDRALAEEGARESRVMMAKLTPFFIRGAFIATFMNKYTGLPMALTGALMKGSSVQRVKETASFFTTATLPRALERRGPGFRAAAMVRLMHSVVRANLLMRPGVWDVSVYGIPIPQVDQMPAGTMPSIITAMRAVRERRGFTRRERAIVELCRRQCALLGVHPDLLPETPRGIIDAITTYSATLRDGYDDATNGELVRGTMAAYLPADRRLRSQLFDRVERSVSKVFFKHTFQVPSRKARQMGVVPSPFDYAMFAGFQAYAVPRVVGHILAAKIPIAGRIADARLIRELDELLASYGHAEYTSDPTKYRAA